MYERQIMNVIEKSILGKHWRRMPWRMISAKASRTARKEYTPIRDKIAISCMWRQIREFSSHAIRHGLYIKNRKWQKWLWQKWLMTKINQAHPLWSEPDLVSFPVTFPQSCLSPLLSSRPWWGGRCDPGQWLQAIGEAGQEWRMAIMT